jgi:hypothetical protein
LGASHRFEPVGFWINTGWQGIRQDLNRRLNYRKLKVLFSDGGPGIEENLLGAGMKPQRCLWHGKRDFPYLLYGDGVKKGKEALLVEKLKSIPALQLGLKSCGTAWKPGGKQRKQTSTHSIGRNRSTRLNRPCCSNAGSCLKIEHISSKE